MVLSEGKVHGQIGDLRGEINGLNRFAPSLGDANRNYGGGLVTTFTTLVLQLLN